MTSSAAVVLFEEAMPNDLLRRARERGLSLAESRALEWFLACGEVDPSASANGASPVQRPRGRDDSRLRGG